MNIQENQPWIVNLDQLREKEFSSRLKSNWEITFLPPQFISVQVKWVCLCIFILNFIAGIKELPEFPFPPFLWHFKLRLKPRTAAGKIKDLASPEWQWIGQKNKESPQFCETAVGFVCLYSGKLKEDILEKQGSSKSTCL